MSKKIWPSVATYNTRQISFKHDQISVSQRKIKGLLSKKIESLLAQETIRSSLTDQMGY